MEGRLCCQHYSAFFSDGVVIINELLLLVEQIGAVRFGDEVTRLDQFTVVSLPFFEEFKVLGCPAPCHSDILWACDPFPRKDRYRGLEGVRWAAVAELFRLLEPCSTFFFSALQGSTGGLTGVSGSKRPSWNRRSSGLVTRSFPTPRLGRRRACSMGLL